MSLNLAEPLNLIYSPSIDNRSFYEAKIERAFSTYPLNYLQWENLPSELQAKWNCLPILLLTGELTQNPSAKIWLRDGLLKEDEEGLLSTPLFNQSNRVLMERDLQDSFVFFSSPTCAPCRSLTRTFQSHQIQYDKANERSILWHEMNVQMTPAFLWHNRYYFEGSKGLKLTPYSHVLSENN